MAQVHDFLKPKEAAEFLRVSASTLAKWRMLGTGPRYAKLGSTVVYPVQDLRRFVEQSTTATDLEC